MKVLIACEESQRVCSAFRRGGMKRIVAILLNRVAVILNGTSRVMQQNW